MCGTGKTIQIINYINQNPDKKYLFITPFLTEIERIKKSCPKLKFEEPPVFGNKIQGLKYLLNKQKFHYNFSYLVADSSWPESKLY